MINIIESWATGQYKILFWFLAAIILVYIPFMFLYLHKRKEKGRLFEHSHKDAVSCILILILKEHCRFIPLTEANLSFFMRLPGRVYIYYRERMSWDCSIIGRKGVCSRSKVLKILIYLRRN